MSRKRLEGNRSMRLSSKIMLVSVLLGFGSAHAAAEEAGRSFGSGEPLRLAQKLPSDVEQRLGVRPNSANRDGRDRGDRWDRRDRDDRWDRRDRDLGTATTAGSAEPTAPASRSRSRSARRATSSARCPSSIAMWSSAGGAAASPSRAASTIAAESSRPNAAVADGPPQGRAARRAGQGSKHARPCCVLRAAATS